MGAAAGCYMVHAVNKESYFAVMKQVPPLGALWIWAIIELDLVCAVLNLATVAGFSWYYGYTVV